jgi:hypothetical protein
MNYNPVTSDPVHEFDRRAVRRTIIDYLNLHRVGSEILCQQAPQRFLQVIRSHVVRWNHYRPKGPMCG